MCLSYKIAIPVKYNISNSWILSLKSSPSAYLTTLHRDYVSKETACNSPITDQQHLQYVPSQIYSSGGAEKVGEN